MLRFNTQILFAVLSFRKVARAGAFRHYHDATADFIKYGKHGKLIIDKIPIKMDDRGSTYVGIPTDVGRALDAGNALSDSVAALNGSAKSTLSFFHDTRHFEHRKLALLHSIL